jgi:hypothetical protein
MLTGLFGGALVLFATEALRHYGSGVRRAVVLG